MIEGYRITPETEMRKAFSGEGSKTWGGRWNSPGIAVVYTAASRSLAMLEVLVHIRGTPGGGPPTRRPYVLYRISFDEALLEELSDSSLAPGWNQEPPTAASQSVGDAWIASRSGPVLSVPSVIVPEERNYLLNPNHPRFDEIQIAVPVPCAFDPRLL